MSKITHPGTGFLVGDPDISPLSAENLPKASIVGEAASSLILSASGWRKVFAEDGDEESDSPSVSPADLVLAGAAAIAYAKLLRSRDSSKSPVVLVGIDSRPTGPAIADAMVRAFLGLGLEPRYLFIVAAPEIMAYARAEYIARGASAGAGARDSASGLGRGSGRASGFAYVSASHNPRGHNGLKFGAAPAQEAGGRVAAPGGVLVAADSAALIAEYRALLADPRIAARVLALMEAVEPREVSRVFADCSQWKRRSVSAYSLFAREVVSGTDDPEAQERLFDEMAEAAALRPVGVVAELNGSARCLSIDLDFLEGLGVAARAVNARPRDFAHRIVPEGESLLDAMRELEAAAAEDPRFAAAYVPDCDGDRGNLVVLTGGQARPVEAQEVFALSCVAELAQLVRDGRLSYDESGNAREKAAIVVNDATSMRVNAIAKAFDVDVFRSETGEANVVGLAASLREKGYIVRLLGEGSNGGNITHPSAVRDPLATLGALLKLLLVRGQNGLFRIWLRRSGRDGRAFDESFGVGELLASLPAYATTSVFEPRAALKVGSADHAALKARYATLFAREFEERRAELLRRFGVERWEGFASNGQAETRVGSDFAASGRGGLRIALSDGESRPRAFLWMRGSGTESVFRIMADVEGGRDEDERYLLAWHESLVRKADAPA
jgi:phosphoglucomutase